MISIFMVNEQDKYETNINHWQAAYSSILKMDVTCSCKNVVVFQHTTQCYIPEERTLCDTLLQSMKEMEKLLLLKYAFHGPPLWSSGLSSRSRDPGSITGAARLSEK
jgi:hypothetical protein